jgi:hypothetical protein
MTRPEKYKFKVSIDQFHNSVQPYFEDSSETQLIDIFENEILNLQLVDKDQYTMIELGSNQCFYSLLFKCILSKQKTKNIMVEPVKANLIAGKKEFQTNDCEGIFYNAIIGERKMTANALSFADIPVITFKQIFAENCLKTIDVLHCDIDGFEVDLLNDNYDFFKKGTFNLIFLSTHFSTPAFNNNSTHNFCKTFFEKMPYNLTNEISDYSIGSDSLLVYKKIT